MTTETMPRYALYFAPDRSGVLWRLGSEWLGRCAASGQAVEPPRIDAFTAEEFSTLTAAPRRYGFHATLKAPFRLADGRTVQMLLAELRAWCATQAPFQMPRLEVVLLDDFLALLPARGGHRADATAAQCVMRFDKFRAPLTAEEIARRNPHRLDGRAARMLELWGYPHVLDLFRFHFSLTGPLPGNTRIRDDLRKAAEGHFAPPAVLAPIFDSVCVFEEPEPGADFHLVERAHFGC